MTALSWQPGSIANPLAEYSYAIGNSRRFFHLVGIDDAPMSCGELMTTQAYYNSAIRSVPKYPINYFCADATRHDGNILASLQVRYYYGSAESLALYTLSAATMSGAFAPSGEGWINTSFTVDDRPKNRIIKRSVGVDGDWQYIGQVWHAMNQQYQDVLVCEIRNQPSCGYWSIAPTLNAQILAGDWPGAPEIYAEAADGREDDYLMFNDGFVDTRRLRFLSRSSSGITIAPSSGSNSLIDYSALGHFYLLDESTTGVDRVWQRSLIWEGLHPHYPAWNNLKPKEIWDAAGELTAGLLTWELWVDSHQQKNTTVVRQIGGTWSMLRGGTRLIATCASDPATDGAEWFSVFDGSLQATTTAWDYCHHTDQPFNTSHYGIARKYVSDDPAETWIEVCNSVSILFPRGGAFSSSTRLGLQASEIIPMPNRDGLGLRLAACRLEDVHNEMLARIGGNITIDASMAESVGIYAEFDYCGRARTQYADTILENFYGYTFVRSLVASLRGINFASFRVRVDNWNDPPWDSDNYDYHTAFHNAFSAAIGEAQSDYPDVYAVTESDYPPSSESKPNATDDGTWRGRILGYRAGWEYARDLDRLDGYYDYYFIGYSEGLADTTYDPAGTGTVTGGPGYQEGAPLGYSDGYDDGLMGGYPGPHPPWDAIAPSAANYFYLPPGWWQFGSYTNLSSVATEYGNAYGTIQGSVSWSSAGTLSTGDGLYYVWRRSFRADVTLADHDFDYAVFFETIYSQEPTTETTRYVREIGPYWGATDIDQYCCLSRVAPVLHITGAPDSEIHPGHYDPAKTGPDYGAPLLPPPQWAG